MNNGYTHSALEKVRMRKYVWFDVPTDGGQFHYQSVESDSRGLTPSHGYIFTLNYDSPSCHLELDSVTAIRSRV